MPPQYILADQDILSHQIDDISEDPTSCGGQSGNCIQRRITAAGPFLADPLLALSADIVDDLEQVRKANTNRLNQLIRATTDSDGIQRGLGLAESDSDVVRIAALVASVETSERSAVRNLERVMKAHPLGLWIAGTYGIGLKQGARLLAVIGDPYFNTLHNRPRTVAELWAYCGLHTLPIGIKLGATSNHSSFHGTPSEYRIAAARKRGEKSNWSNTAKMRAYLIAKQIEKIGGPYRTDVYDSYREKHADATHVVPCVRCGPAGKPAQPGTPLNLGHQQARALRKVAQVVLRDLWRESKRLHDERT